MRYLLLLALLAGCSRKKDVYVTITCMDSIGNVTAKIPHYKGAFQLIEDPSSGYESVRCVIEKDEFQ